MKIKRTPTVVFAVIFFVAWAAVVRAIDIMPFGDSLTRGLKTDP